MVQNILNRERPKVRREIVSSSVILDVDGAAEGDGEGFAVGVAGLEGGVGA